MEFVFGLLATGFSLAVIFIGMPCQIIKNYKNKSCKGLSLSNMVLVLGCNFSWLAYGLTKNDFALIITNPLNLVLTIIVLVQFYIYRNS